MSQKTASVAYSGHGHAHKHVYVSSSLISSSLGHSKRLLVIFKLFCRCSFWTILFCRYWIFWSIFVQSDICTAHKKHSPLFGLSL